MSFPASRCSLLRVAGVLLLALAILPAQEAPKLTLAPLFSPGMVLQQGSPVNVWGQAAPGVVVSVSFAGKTATATAGEDGRWLAKLPPLEAAAATKSLEVAAKDSRIVVPEVRVGEVWICSGQSNMWWPLERTAEAQAAIAAADNPDVRLFTVPQKTSAQPLSTAEGAWVPATPQNTAKFSAVAWYFGQNLQRELKVPVGLIHTSWGGTPCEAWTSREALESSPEFKPILDRSADEKANAPGRGAFLFNAMINPLVPYTLRGAIWYQGEANIGRAWQYRSLFPAMINDWRTRFGQGDFPFLFVQLAPFRYNAKDPKACTCAELRDSQLETLLTVPNTGMAVTMDIGNPVDIHPANKKDVGERLARWALAKTYGKKDVVFSGPLFRKAEVQGDRIRVSFDHATGLHTRDGKAPSHFQVAGEDQKFVDAVAEIQGETVIVHADAVKAPVAVRYAFTDDAEPNLENGTGLPASPFRSDDWPAVTKDAK